MDTSDATYDWDSRMNILRKLNNTYIQKKNHNFDKPNQQITDSYKNKVEDKILQQ